MALWNGVVPVLDSIRNDPRIHNGLLADAIVGAVLRVLHENETALVIPVHAEDDILVFPGGDPG